jgi:hypothetical protein
LTTDTFWGAALASETSADELGIETGRDRARWDDAVRRAADIKEVRGFILSGGASPGAQVSALMKHTAAALRDGSAGVA